MDVVITELGAVSIEDIVGYFAGTPYSAVINAAIVLLALACILVWIGHGWRYRWREARALKTLEMDMEFWLDSNHRVEPEPDDDETDGAPTVSPSIALYDLNEMLTKVSSATLVFKRIAALNEMKRLRVKVSVASLQDATLSDEASRLGLNLPAFAANLLVIMGLLGTFVGLAVVVSEISVLMPDAGDEAYIAARMIDAVGDMDQVLVGIRTAFSTSIMGIIGAILCFWAQFDLSRLQIMTIGRLDRLTVERLLPITVPAVEDEHLLERVSYEVRDTFDRLQYLADRNTNILEELNELQKGFRTIVSDIREITHREQSKDIDRVIGQIANTNESAARIVELLPKIVEVVQHNSENVGNDVRALIEQSEQQRSMFEKEMNRIVRIKNGGVVVNFTGLRSYSIVACGILILAIAIAVVMR